MKKLTTLVILLFITNLSYALECDGQIEEVMLANGEKYSRCESQVLKEGIQNILTSNSIRNGVRKVELNKFIDGTTYTIYSVAEKDRRRFGVIAYLHQFVKKAVNEEERRLFFAITKFCSTELEGSRPRIFYSGNELYRLEMEFGCY